MEIIIEEISRGHKLIGRHKFSQSSVSLGRGYGSDIIIADPHVCAQHLTISFNGEHWVAHDENSVNGSFFGDGKVPIDDHIINSGDIITLGKSQVRIVFPDHPVEPSVNFSPFETLIDIARHPISLTLSVMTFACVTAWLFYLNNPKEVTFTQLLVPAIGMAILFSLWPICVAVTSHLTKHDARTMSQLGVSFLFFNIMWFSDIIERLVQFNVSSNWPFSWLITLLPMALAYCLFWFNCSIGFHMPDRKRIVVAASLTALLFGSGFLIQLSKKPDFNPRPKYNATIMTPHYLVTSANDVETFIEDSSKLFAKARKKIKADE